MTGDQIQEIASAFLAGRAENRTLSDYPGPLPRTMTEGYAIQERAIALVEGSIGGWKVGRIPGALVDRHGDDRLAGPIWADSIRHPDSPATPMPILDGFAAVEAELMIRLHEPGDRPLSTQEVEERVSEVRLGIEIASSPFIGINEHGPAVTVSDFGNNHGLLIGPPIDDWRSIDLPRVPVSTAIDDTIMGTGTLADMLDGAFGAIAWLTRHLAGRDRA